MNDGDALPDLALTAADGTPLRLQALSVPLVIFVFPKADTPGCTQEAVDFSALAPDFAAAGTHLLGVSRDAPAKLTQFAARRGIAVALAADESGAVTEALGVWGEKLLYGRRYMGLERATFLFDRRRRLAASWRRVRVAGHAEAVLAAANTLD